MSSLIGNSATQEPNLRGKINQVKHLLDDANKRLQDEVSRDEIFKTKTSASPISSPKPLENQNGGNYGPGLGSAADIKRTISDIGTIQSVLSCPIFNRIVNVTDSLDKLSFHLNLRPSIGPADVNIDDNGELILAPPIEPTSLNNYINSQLDERSSTDHSNSLHLSNQHAAVQNGSFKNNHVNHGEPMSHHSNEIMTITNLDGCNEGYRRQQEVSNARQNTNDYIRALASTGQQQMVNQFLETERTKNFATKQPKNNNSQSCNATSRQVGSYGTEKPLAPGGSSKRVLNETQPITNMGTERTTRVKSVAAAFECAFNGKSGDDSKLHKTSGENSLNRIVPVDLQENPVNGTQYQSKDGLDSCEFQETERLHGSLGYSNQFYQDENELDNLNSSYNGKRDGEFYADATYANANIRKQNQPAPARNDFSTKPQVERTNRVSPSISAGSTVRLADECDSGTSSFRSQAAKGTLYSPQSHKPIEQLDEDPMDTSIDQELIEKLSPEMERIKVTLEKGPEGIGITIAGYTCEQEEISGIFIKGITPGSPADRCGKIKILDQIFAVNGQEILGYSNPEATNVLRRHTGRVVTLELMRYLAESRYQKLQNLLESAAPVSSLRSAELKNQTGFNDNKQSSESAVPISSYNQTIFSPLDKPDERAHLRATDILPESIYKNSSVFTEHKFKNDLVANNRVLGNTQQAQSQSLMPVAAHRLSGTSNKVIETKQGARNTIDIRSPLCQTTATATYVNKLADADVFDSSTRNSISITDRLRQETPEKLIRGDEPEWEKNVEIVELHRDSSSQGLGFTVKEYLDPKDQKKSIIMITSITPGSIAETNGLLSSGDLLVFVDDKNLEGASLNEAVKALKETNGQVSLGVLKLKR